MPEPSDLRNMLAEATTAAEAAETPIQSPKTEAATEAPEKPEAPSGERARGPDGKFLPKEASDSEESEQDPLETVEEEVEAEPVADKPVEPTIDVPQHWSQADKDLVAKLPQEHRQAVVDRYKAIESGFTPKLQRAAEIEKLFGPAQELFAPHTEVLRQRGQTPSDIIRVWASVEQGFLEGMREASQGMPNQKGALLVANLIRSYKVDPGAVASILQGQTAEVPSGEQRINGQIPQELVQRLQQLEERENQRIQSTQAERISIAQRQIDTFAAEKDAAGNLAHPFFPELENEIMGLAQIDRSQGKPLDLADLYDRAIYANRETRAKLLATKEAEAKQKAAADRKAKAAAAQRAASSVTGSTGSGQAPDSQRQRAKTLREELQDQVAESDAA